MIYFVRHGETDWNVERRAQGRADIVLNANGVKQAQELADILDGLPFDLCFSSPLKRARQTAEIINKGKLVIDERLIERGFGELEGLTNWRDFGIDLNNENETRFGIEPANELKKRIADFWSEIFNQYRDKDILIVSHRGIGLWTFKYIFGDVHSNDYYQRFRENCALIEIDSNVIPVTFD